MSRLQPISTISTSLRPAAGIVVMAFCAQAAHSILFIPLLQAYLPGHFHWTPAFVGYTLTVVATAKLVTQTPAGRLVDIIGTRRAALGGLSLLFITGGLFAITGIPGLFLVVACVYGLGSAFLWPAIFSVAANQYGEDLRGRIAAAIQFAEAGGVAVGAGAGAFLVDRLGYAPGFGFYLLLSAIAVVAVFFATRSRRRTSAGPALPVTPDLAIFQGSPVLAIRRSLASFLRGLLSTPMTVDLGLLIGVGFLLTLAPNLLLPIINDYAVHNLGVKLDQLILPGIPVVVVGIIAMLASGAASDKVGRLPFTLAGLCLGAVGFWFIGSAHAILVAMIAGGAGAAGYLITQPAWSAAVFDASTEQHRGTQFGVIMVAQGVAEAVAPALGGKVAESFGPGAAFQLSGAVLALGAVLTAAQILYRRSRERGK